MLLNKDTCNYLKNKIKGKSYGNKEYVRYILLLIELEDYIKNGFKGPYFHGFLLDYLIDKYFEEYIYMVIEIKGKYEGERIKKNHNIKEKYLCTGVDFSYSGALEKYEDIWIELGGKK